MTNRSVIELRVSETERLLSELRAYGSITEPQLKADSKLRGTVLWHLFSITQLVIELGDAMIAVKNLRRPGSYRETFDILAEQDLLDRQLAEQLVKMTGLRNVLAHTYLTINLAIVADAVNQRLSDVDAFLAVIKTM